MTCSEKVSKKGLFSCDSNSRNIKLLVKFLTVVSERRYLVITRESSVEVIARQLLRSKKSVRNC